MSHIVVSLGASHRTTREARKEKEGRRTKLTKTTKVLQASTKRQTLGSREIEDTLVKESNSTQTSSTVTKGE